MISSQWTNLYSPFFSKSFKLIVRINAFFVGEAGPSSRGGVVYKFVYKHVNEIIVGHGAYGLIVYEHKLQLFSANFIVLGFWLVELAYVLTFVG